MFVHKRGIPQHATFKNDSSCPWKFFNQGEGKRRDNTWIFPPVQSMPTFKDWAKSKILSPFRTLQEVISLTIITHLNTWDLASCPKPSLLHNPALPQSGVITFKLPFMQSSSWLLKEESNDTSNSTQNSALPLTRHNTQSLEVSSNLAWLTVQLHKTSPIWEHAHGHVWSWKMSALKLYMQTPL